jgi:hypothetical protein
MASTAINTDNMPDVPGERYTIKQIREMNSFSGVYIAYVGDEIVYIGESKDVTGRVSKSRPELKDCTSVAVIECPVEHRLRLESYLIGKHNPSRNHENSDNQKVKLAEKGWNFSKQEAGCGGAVVFSYREMFQQMKQKVRRCKKEECEVFYQNEEVYIPSAWVGLSPMHAMMCMSHDGMSLITRNEVAYVPIEWAIEEYSPYEKDKKLVSNLKHVKETILHQIAHPEEQDPESTVPYWEPSQEDAEAAEEIKSVVATVASDTQPEKAEEQTKKALFLREAGEYLGVSYTAICKMVQEGTLHAFTLPHCGKKKFIQREDLDRLVLQHAAKPADTESGAA